MIGRPTQCPSRDRHHLVEEIPGGPSGPVSAPKPYGGKLPPPPKPAGPPRSLRPGEALCPCNEIIPPRTSRTGKTFECAKCGRKGRVEAATDEKGAPVMKAIVTQEPAVQSKPPVVSAPVPPPLPAQVPGPQGVFDSPVQVSEEGVPAALPDDAQAVICACAAELLVSRADVGQTIQCPMCTTVMTVEEVPDPSDGTSTLRVRGIGSFDQPDWKLDDFQ